MFVEAGGLTLVRAGTERPDVLDLGFADVDWMGSAGNAINAVAITASARTHRM